MQSLKNEEGIYSSPKFHKKQCVSKDSSYNPASSIYQALIYQYY